MMDELPSGVQVVHDYIGVAGVASSEDNHLEVLAQVSQDLSGVWSDVYAGLDDLSCGEFDGEADGAGGVWRVVAVDEGLIKVEDDGLAVCMQVGVPSQPFLLGRVSRILRISSSEHRLLRSSILSTFKEVTKCSLARDFQSWQARMSSETQQTLCLGEQGLLLKVRNSACSGTCVTSPLRLTRLSPQSMRCFSSFFRCRFRFISVILCSIESNFSCNFLYSLLYMNCFFRALTRPPYGLTRPYVLNLVGYRSGRTMRSRYCGWSLWVERTFMSLISCTCGLVRYFCEQELGRVRLEVLVGGGGSGEFLRLPQSSRSCSLAFRARCQYSTNLVWALRLVGEKVWRSMEPVLRRPSSRRSYPRMFFIKYYNQLLPPSARHPNPISSLVSNSNKESHAPMRGLGRDSSIKIIQMEEGIGVFAQVVERVSKLSLFYQILEYQETRLQLSSFRLQKLLPGKALQTYERIVNKHVHSSELCPRSDAWYESEKRLFAWFMAFHSYLERDGQSFKNDHDFAALSKVFFKKDADFLEFHWLVMVRSSEKAAWEEDQQAMLLVAIGQLEYDEASLDSNGTKFHTDKTLFRSPKTCRERWLNHLDHSKVKGNWTVQEDIAIFAYVVEEGKRWSRLVGVLGGKRTEHTIKNRFNAMIAKNRRYKFEKDIKVALRILEQLRTGMQGEPKKHMESRFKEENISYEDSFEEKEERKHYKVEEKSEQAEVEFPLTIKMEVSPQQQPPQKLEQPAHIQVKHEQPPAQIKQEQPHDVVYPFQLYSYECYDYNQACLQHYQMLYYQQMMALPPMPTADTTSNRQTKIAEQRRRRREKREG